MYLYIIYASSNIGSHWTSTSVIIFLMNQNNCGLLPVYLEIWFEISKKYLRPRY